MALKPATQAIKSGEQDPFIYICLVKLVSDFPLQSCRYDDASGDAGMIFKPLLRAMAGSDITEQNAS